MVINDTSLAMPLFSNKDTLKLNILPLQFININAKLKQDEEKTKSFIDRLCVDTVETDRNLLSH